MVDGRRALVAFAVTELIALLRVSQHPETIFDEAAHLDYVVKLAHGHMPRVYEDPRPGDPARVRL